MTIRAGRTQASSAGESRTGVAPRPWSCDTFAVHGAHTPYAATLLAKNSDRPAREAQPLRWLTARGEPGLRRGGRRSGGPAAGVPHPAPALPGAPCGRRPRRRCRLRGGPPGAQRPLRGDVPRRTEVQPCPPRLPHLVHACAPVRIHLGQHRQLDHRRPPPKRPPVHLVGGHHSVHQRVRPGRRDRVSTPGSTERCRDPARRGAQPRAGGCGHQCSGSYWWSFQHLLEAVAGDADGSSYHERQRQVRSVFDQLQQQWLEQADDLAGVGTDQQWKALTERCVGEAQAATEELVRGFNRSRG